MLRIVISCILFVSHFSSIFSAEKTILFESSKVSLNIETDETDQQVVMQGYTLENISEKIISGLFFTINIDREKQKKSLLKNLSIKTICGNGGRLKIALLSEKESIQLN